MTPLTPRGNLYYKRGKRYYKNEDFIISCFYSPCGATYPIGISEKYKGGGVSNTGYFVRPII
jgi:hypothetical protein